MILIVFSWKLRQKICEQTLRVTVHVKWKLAKEIVFHEVDQIAVLIIVDHGY